MDDSTSVEMKDATDTELSTTDVTELGKDVQNQEEVTQNVKVTQSQEVTQNQKVFQSQVVTANQEETHKQPATDVVQEKSEKSPDKNNIESQLNNQDSPIRSAKSAFGQIDSAASADFSALASPIGSENPPTSEDLCASDTLKKEENTSAVSENKPEKFQAEIQNLPRFYTFKQLKTHLKRLKITHGNLKVLKTHAYLTFATEKERDFCIETLHKTSIKGRTLRVLMTTGPKHPEKRRFEPSNESITPENTAKQPKIQRELTETSILDTATPLWNMPYNEQLEWKQQESQKALETISRQIGAIPNKSEVLRQILPSAVTENYRNKCEFSLGLNANGDVAVGFQVAAPEGKGYCVLSPEKCTHLPLMMEKCRRFFETFLKNSSLPIFDQNTQKGIWRMLTIRCFRFDLMVVVTVHPQDFSEAEIDGLKRSLSEAFMPKEGRIAEGFRVTSLYLQRLRMTSDKPIYEHIKGSPYALETLFHRIRFAVSPGAFFQTNSRGAEVLYKTIGQFAKTGENTVLLDICCGTGTIGISLAAQVRHVVGVEIVSEAVDDARQNAIANGVTNVRFVRGAAEHVFQEIHHFLPADFDKEDSNYDLVGVLDPPRAGLHDKLITGIRKMERIRRLVYVSCDPRQASKNFLDLCRQSSNKFPGVPFTMQIVQPVDMFPQTRHFEWVVLFTR